MVGIFAVNSKEGASENYASNLVYLCLYALQHRGQEGSGIAVSTCDDGIQVIKGDGLVSEVYNEERLAKLNGNIAVGNNKYSTRKDRNERNVLPMVADLAFGQMAISFSGTLLSEEYRRTLVNNGAIFTTSSDSEVLLHMIARRSINKPVLEAIVEVLSEVDGAYSITMMLDDKLIAARDPNGFKPLIIGKKDEAHIVVSETAALDLVGAEYIREVLPGEVIVISESGVESYVTITRKGSVSPCLFELVYIARPDSIVYGKSMYNVRVSSGKKLAQQSPVVDADLVVPVPDSGIAAAIGYSQESGVPFALGIVRNHYVGRTFIKPTQEIRNFSIKVKLNPVKSVISGKRVVVIDDSIVRGNTSKLIVQMLKDAGAAEVHMRIASPPVMHTCKYGIDTPDVGGLIAHQHTVQEISDLIGADSLDYLHHDMLIESANSNVCEGDVCSVNYCAACFNGKYPL